MIEVTEKQLEDWVCANLARVVGHEDAVLVGRQIQLVSGGILDVLAARWGRPACDTLPTELKLTVIELKRDVIDDRAVAQVLGYMGALDRMANIMDPIKIRHPDGDREAPYVNIEGILAAPHIDDNAQYAISASVSLRYVRLRPTVAVEQVESYLTDHITPPPHVGSAVSQRTASAICNALRGVPIPAPIDDEQHAEASL